MRAGKVCALYNSRSRFSRFADALPRPTAAAPGGGKNFFVQNAENPLTKSTFHAKISKSSGLTDVQEVNMGVFPSGQWGQTVNLLLSASVVRIHPRPPRTPVSNGYRSFCFICLAKGTARVDSNSCGAVAEDSAKTAQWAVFSSAARAIHPRPPKNLNVCKCAEVFVL